MKIVLAAAVLVALGEPAAARPQRLVVSLERTACFGACPVYTVAIYDDASVRWQGKANVARKGSARGRADPAKLDTLVDAFVKARFFEMEPDGEILPPLPKGAMRAGTVPCTDTSHAITTFRHDGKTRTLDDPHCKGANALTALERLVDEVAGTGDFIAPPAPPKP
jgi:uncharacterized protein DUF6438